MMDQKSKVLGMLSEGKINVSEAEKLLNALNIKESSPKRESQRFFNVFVDSNREKGTRVKVKVPLQLIKSGMKFANLIPIESRDKIQSVMRDKGINFDLNELDSMKVDELIDALQALEVAVDDGETSETVRIFCD